MTKVWLMAGGLPNGTGRAAKVLKYNVATATTADTQSVQYEGRAGSISQIQTEGIFRGF